MYKVLKTITLSLTIFLSIAIAGTPRDYVRKSFLQRDFLPYVYEDAEIVRAYGVGAVSKDRYEVHRSYYDRKSNRWVTFTGDSEISDKHRTISEITISTAGPIKNKYSFSGTLGGIGLFGLSIGSAENDVIRVAKTKHGFKKKKAVFFGRRLDEVIFYPSSKNTNTYYRYLIDEGKVVAFALGITE